MCLIAAASMHAVREALLDEADGLNTVRRLDGEAAISQQRTVPPSGWGEAL
jgi:hypothetical protein